MAKKILVVSDLHCGSIFGMLPPNFETSDGTIRPQNAGQKHLWSCWNATVDYANKVGIDVIVVNGDVVDGTQRAQHGTELSLPLLFDQKGAAIDTLRPISTLAPMYFVKGTEYHDSKAGAEVEAVAEDLHAVRYDGIGQGKFAKDILDLEVEDVVVNFAHGISVAAGFYRATAHDREGIWSALAGKDGKMPKADAVVRSHAHFFIHVEHASKHIVGSPCWQLQTGYMRKNSAYRMLPDIGALIIHVDGQAKKDGRDPIWIEKLLFPLPEVKPTKARIDPTPQKTYGKS